MGPNVMVPFASSDLSADGGCFPGPHRLAPGEREMSSTPHSFGVTTLLYGSPGAIPEGNARCTRTHESATGSAAKIMRWSRPPGSACAVNVFFPPGAGSFGGVGVGVG